MIKTADNLALLSLRTKKQKCPTYLKSIGKSKALAVTLSDIELEDDFDNEDDGILNAFIATVNPTDGIVEDIVEEEELVESMSNYTSFLRNMRNSIGWPPRNSVMWNLTVKNYPQSLMRLIKILEH